MENKKKAGRPRKDFTANMDSVLQDKEDGKRYMTVRVSDLVIERNVRHSSMWGTDNYDPEDISNYDQAAIEGMRESMQANLDAGRQLCNQAPTVWIDEQGRLLVQLGKTRAITMKTYFPDLEQMVSVEDQPVPMEVQLQENTVRTNQKDIDIASTIYSMPTKKDRVSYAATIGWTKLQLSSWMKVMEHSSQGTLSLIRNGRLDVKVAANLDEKLQYIVCEYMRRFEDAECNDMAKVSNILGCLQDVECANDLLPFMEGHEEYLKDVVYIKRDGVYCDIYILDAPAYQIWYDKNVLEPQLRKVSSSFKNETIESLRTNYNGYKEPIQIFEIPNGKVWMPGQPDNKIPFYGQPYLYRYQFGYLADDTIVKVGDNYTVAKTKLAESIPKEEVLRELRCDFADEAIHVASLQAMCDMLAVQMGLPTKMTVEKFLHRLAMSFQRKLSEAALQELVNASSKDWEEIYAAAEQRVRDTRFAKNAKKIEGAELVFENYAYLWFPYDDAVQVLLPKKRSADKQEYAFHKVHFALDWNDLDSVARFFVKAYSSLEEAQADHKRTGDVFRKSRTAAKRMGAKVEWYNTTDDEKIQAWVREVKALMMRLESKFPLEVSEAKMRAKQKYDMFVFLQEESKSLLNVLEEDELSEEEKAEFLRTHRYDVTSMKYVAIEDDDLEARALGEVDDEDLFDDMETGGEDEDRELSDEEYEAYQNNINNDK